MTVLVHNIRKSYREAREGKNIISFKDLKANLMNYLIIFMMIMAVATIVINIFGNHRVEKEFTSAGTVNVVVEDGDTIWTIAEETGFVDKVGKEKVINKIQAMNGINSHVTVGQVLEIPVVSK
jgi:cell division protein YceG involved in septum cleavage